MVPRPPTDLTGDLTGALNLTGALTGGLTGEVAYDGYDKQFYAHACLTGSNPLYHSHRLIDIYLF